MCDTALIFHTSFEEMEGWDPDVLLSRREAAVKMAKAIYGGK
jgi:hypothetical protein